MTKLTRLRIVGFRGILAPLDIELKGQSLVILGQNGSGKSSVTDALEWLVSGKILHLGIEGAGPGSYPHARVGTGGVFVEAEFDSGIGLVRREYDHERITKPKSIGKLAELSALAPHPSYVRFADLSRFVLLTKTERYDSLAILMGFSRQVEAQKALRRVQRQFREHFAAIEKKVRDASQRLSETLGVECRSIEDVARALAPIASRRKLSPIRSESDLRTAVSTVRALVQDDPVAVELAAEKLLESAVGKVGSLSALRPTVEEFLKVGRPFKEMAEQLKGILLVSLLEKGLESLTLSQGSNVCPLCGREFEADLRLHVKSELESLRAIKESHDETSAALRSVNTAVPKAVLSVSLLEEAVAALKGSKLLGAAEKHLKFAVEVNARVAFLAGRLPKVAREIDGSVLTAAREMVAELQDLEERLAKGQAALRSEVVASITSKAGDKTRKELVADFELVQAAAARFADATQSVLELGYASTVLVELDAEVEAFVAACIQDVEKRFASISSEVAACFAVLEEATPGLEKPVLRILTDQDRSVVLEVTLHNESVSPAYKYLSESQLNSFGLAVFLASVRAFNPNFKLVVLDDVVNSLDGFKRPLVIKLLKTRFADRQFILLTHDASWRDRLSRELPAWKRLHFRRNDPASGPVVAQLKPPVADIQSRISADEPLEAGQRLGPLIEEELQDVAEALQAQVTFNRRNEYTLDPLLAAVRRRLDDKLKSAHPAALAAKKLFEEAGFRNLCAHAKNPAIEFTAHELKLALDAFTTLMSHLRCANPKCNELVKWVDPVFRCGCGATELARTP